MMKKTIRYIGIILMLALCASCQEKNLLTYNEEALGNSIYFVDKYSKNDNNSMTNQVYFGSGGKETTDTIVAIPIRITGAPIAQDRPVKVTVSDTSSMFEGEYFDFLNTPAIRANRVLDTLYLRVYRKQGLQEKRVYLNLLLESNSYFNTLVPINKNGSYNQELLSYRLAVDDMFPVSYIWLMMNTTATDYLGLYSREKVELMMQVLNIPYEVFFDDERAPVSPAIMGWGNYMKNWLLKEKREGRIYYYNDRGVQKEITMGRLAQ